MTSRNKKYVHVADEILVEKSIGNLLMYYMYAYRHVKVNNLFSENFQITAGNY